MKPLTDKMLNEFMEALQADRRRVAERVREAAAKMVHADWVHGKANVVMQLRALDLDKLLEEE